MCSRPSVPLVSSMNAPKAVVLTTLPVNLSPTSASLVIASMRAMHASTRAPFGAYTCTVPSSSTLMSASNSSDRARIVSPPLPIRAPIFSGSILICSIRGAYSRELLARPRDRLLHRLEDEQPPPASLLERIAQDVEGDPGDLDVHLKGGDPVGGAGDLEVHVAEVVLDAGDVGEHHVVVALLDQAHRDPGHGARHRHAGGHQRHRRGAHRAHRRGPVRLQRLRDDPNHVGKVVRARDRRHQRPLGERAVADVAALRAAHEAGLPDRERREVVVVPEGLRLRPG